MTKLYFGKLYWKCKIIFPILHKEGGVYDLYCSQPPEGGQRAHSFTFQNVWGTRHKTLNMQFSGLHSYSVFFCSSLCFINTACTELDHPVFHISVLEWSMPWTSTDCILIGGSIYTKGCFHTSTFGAHPGSIDVRVQFVWMMWMLSFLHPNRLHPYNKY